MSTDFVGLDNVTADQWHLLWKDADLPGGISESERKRLEGLNPSVGCGFSREADEQHAPAAISDPFTKRS